MIKINNRFLPKGTSVVEKYQVNERIAADEKKMQVLREWTQGPASGVTHSLDNVVEAFGKDDFTAVTTDNLHTAMIKGYEGIEPIWPQFVSRRGQTNDLVRPEVRIETGSIDKLSPVKPGEPGEQKNFTDRKMEFEKTMYEGRINFYSEMYDSSNFADLLDVASKMGHAARETVEDFVVNKLFLGMDDAGTFNARQFTFDKDNGSARALYDGNNTLGASNALSSTTLNTAIKTLVTQKDLDGNRIRWRPRYLIVGHDLFVTASELLNSMVKPGANEGHTANVWAGSLELIVTDHIDDGKWFIMADPRIHDTFEIVFWNGFEEPVITPENTLSHREYKWAVDIAFGATPLEPKSIVGANFAP